ncbi:MAG: methyltransferase domain-containing protein [Reyranellaceae bacterium]
MAEMNAAEAYEAYLVPNVFRPWASMVVREARLQPGQRVLDIACGTGIAARTAAPVVGATGAVVGIDKDDAMLEVARALPAHAGDAPMRWQQADAMNLPFPEASFDVALCFEGIQFLPDHAKGLAEFRRVLRSGGRLIGTIWGPLEENPGYHAIGDGVSQFVSPEAGRLPPFLLHDRAEIRALMAGAGFTDVSVEPRRIIMPILSSRHFVNWVAHGAPTVRLRIAQLADKDREAFYAYVDERLEPLRHEGVIGLPMMRHVIEASVP